MCKIHL